MNKVKMMPDSKERFVETNRFRVSMGLRPITPKLRYCLSCNKKFESFGANHRLCGCVPEDEKFTNVIHWDKKQVFK